MADRATGIESIISDMYFKHIKVDIGDEMHIHFRGNSLVMKVANVKPIFSKVYPSLEIGVSVESDFVGVLE